MIYYVLKESSGTIGCKNINTYRIQNLMQASKIWPILEEKFEDFKGVMRNRKPKKYKQWPENKGVIRNRKPKKARKCNVQKKIKRQTVIYKNHYTEN